MHKIREHWISLLAFTVVTLLFWWRGFPDFLGGLLHHGLVIVIAVGFGVLISVAKIWREVQILLEQHTQTHERLRKPLALFFRNHLLKLGTLRQQLLTGGFEFDLRELERFVAACFKANGSKKYVGTDSNVPSLFRTLYPTYLDEHFNSEKASSPAQDVRILCVSEQDLQIDYDANKTDFKMFIERHEQHYVLLLQVEKADAQKAADEQGLPSTDIGVFGQDFVVFYTPRKRQGAPSGCKVVVEPLSDARNLQLREYLRRLNACAKEIRVVADVLKCEDRGRQQQSGDEERLFGHLKRSR